MEKASLLRNALQEDLAFTGVLEQLETWMRLEGT